MNQVIVDPTKLSPEAYKRWRKANIKAFIKTHNLPEPTTDVMVTYRKKRYSGAYGDTVSIYKHTARGFLSDINLDGVWRFSIPPAYSSFNIGDDRCLLPDGFGGDRVDALDIISWRPLTEAEKKLTHIPHNC